MLTKRLAKLLLNSLAIQTVGLSQESIEAAGEVDLGARVAAACLPRPQSVPLRTSS